MSIEILSPGLNTTIQDGGRLGFQDKGIPVSGFMDVTSAQLANTLVTNELNTAVIEMTLLGIKFKATQAITIAITGADMQPKLNGKSITMYKAVEIPKDGIVTFKGASSGVYGYIAVLGGFKTPRVLGSKSTYVPAKLGGYKGRILQKGDLLPVLHNTLKAIKSKVKTPNFLLSVELFCVKGPEWDWFSTESKTAFLDTIFTIGKDSNRIGIRLEGNKIVLPKKDEIISSGIIKGTVQITKAGDPIVMMADAPTTGGYLRMVNLTQKSCDLLAQVPIGGKVQFILK
ncbi:5-oxoprolinase subunit C family protein [Wenyingzhuangia marina]|uniref:Antagonist of KipI n=1 Tax=Wenyingzhuangia marina TaxID=1195760 RepID=A0A1M5VLB1_9FLAO|nr:biotin-dependent carboxyltransferase family protein [Wenyingzhuangia marina]GGF71386.1 KipI antagonist [Wenyingzhuangia marina]SHH76042.1 antagonist of KipI [Wenyingzhuangia marina]